MIQALIERELRRAMQRERLKSLPLYPEERQCGLSTTVQVLRLYSYAERHILTCAARTVQRLDAEFTPLQRRLLELLGVPVDSFRA